MFSSTSGLRQHYFHPNRYNWDSNNIGNNSSEDEYLPSHTESSEDLSSSENEDMMIGNNPEDISNDAHDQDNPVSNTLKKKGKGRSKLADEGKTRKRKRNPQNWKRIKRYESKTKGLPYYSTANRFVPGKSLKPIRLLM